MLSFSESHIAYLSKLNIHKYRYMNCFVMNIFLLHCTTTPPTPQKNHNNNPQYVNSQYDGRFNCRVFFFQMNVHEQEFSVLFRLLYKLTEFDSHVFILHCTGIWKLIIRYLFRINHCFLSSLQVRTKNSKTCFLFCLEMISSYVIQKMIR